MSDKILSIEEIDAHIAQTAPKFQAEGFAGVNLCGIYKTVRPILVFVKGLLFFKPAWQAILQSLIDALDASCSNQ
jgi:hypothetical protein